MGGCLLAEASAVDRSQITDTLCAVSTTGSVSTSGTVSITILVWPWMRHASKPMTCTLLVTTLAMVLSSRVPFMEGRLARLHAVADEARSSRKFEGWAMFARIQFSS